MTETATPQNPEAKKKPSFGTKEIATSSFSKALEPKDMSETMALANLLSKSEIVPKDFVGKPSNILVAVGLGRSVGFGWAQSLQTIAVINGRPTIWGDGAVGLILNSDVYEDSSDEWLPNLEGGTWIFKSKRKGKNWTIRTFSHNDAQKAGLLGKDAYKKYEKRMLFNRARAFALRDDYADILKGLRIREEEEDFVYVSKKGREELVPQRRSEALPPKSEIIETEKETAGNKLEAGTVGSEKTETEKEAEKQYDLPGALVENVSKNTNGEHQVLIEGKSYSCTPGKAKEAKVLKAAGTRVSYEVTESGILTDIKPYD